MREEDTITIGVELRHRSSDGTSEAIEHLFNQSWIAWPEDSGYEIDNYDILLGDSLELKARKVIDQLLAERRKHHVHGDAK